MPKVYLRPTKEFKAVQYSPQTCLEAVAMLPDGMGIEAAWTKRGTRNYTTGDFPKNTGPGSVDMGLLLSDDTQEILFIYGDWIIQEDDKIAFYTDVEFRKKYIVEE